MKGGKQMEKHRYLIYSAVVVLFFGLLSTNTALGKPYYQGKTMKIIVSGTPGGGTDIFARLIARHLPKFIPGKPNILVRNMPGAMQLVGANYVAVKAKKDGLTVYAGSGVTAVHSLIETKGAKFSYDNMTVVLAVPSGDIHYARRKVIQKREDIVTLGKQLIFGCAPMPYSITITFMLTRALLGFETKKDVLAFDGSQDARRAMFAGEIDIGGESVMGYRKMVYPFVKKGEVYPLWQSGMYDPEGRLTRQGGVAADVPTSSELYELIYGKAPSGPIWEALSSCIAYARSINKTLCFPPGTENYAAIVSEAVMNMAKDPKFQKEADVIFVGAPVYAGEDAGKMLKMAVDKAKASRVWLKQWLHKGWGVEFEK